MDKNEKILLCHLRKNAREKLSTIARQHRIPVSTLFDCKKRLELEYIKKYATIVDFRKLGYFVRHGFITKSDKVNGFLAKHQNVNSLLKLKEGFLADCIFRDAAEAEELKEKLLEIDPRLSEVHYIETLKEEGFL